MLSLHRNIASKTGNAKLINVTGSLSVETPKAIKLTTSLWVEKWKAVRLKGGDHQVDCLTSSGGVDKSIKHTGGWHHLYAVHTSNTVYNYNIMTWRHITDAFPSQTASNVDLWWFHCCYLECAVELTIRLSVIWDSIMLLWCHCNVSHVKFCYILCDMCIYTCIYMIFRGAIISCISKQSA